MAQVQAQIVAHGNVLPEAVEIAEAEHIWAVLHHRMGAVPLDALMEIRAFIESQALAQVHGDPVPNESDFKPTFQLDATETQVWVDPDEFIQNGAACINHRYIVVSPVISVEDMPPLN